MVIAYPLISIRKANKDDNTELLNVERMCPQGKSLVLQFDRSPDFFSRSRVYDRYTVYVAEQEGRIVGTVGTTIKEFNMDGKPVKGIYIYDLRVHPAFRGKGIGLKLVQHVTMGENADLAYGIIMAENLPSIALFKRLGFQNLHDFTLFNVPLYDRKEHITCKTREMTSSDVSQVVGLINDQYRNRDFYTPLTEDDFLKKTKQLTDYGLHNIHVVEAADRILACAGLWDYSRILRAKVLRITTKLKMMSYALRFLNLFTDTMKLPSVGEPFRLMYVRDFAYADKLNLVDELIKHCLNIANSRGCNFLVFPLDPSDPTTNLIAKYKPIRITYHIYAKSLKKETLKIQRMIYVDTADL